MADEKLNIDERLKIMRGCRKAYGDANRRTKGRILDTLQEVTGLARKTVIRHLRGSCERKSRERQRGRKYGGEVDDALRIIHGAHDGICAERLTPNLVLYADKLAVHGHLRLSASVRQLLGEISISTVRRALARIHQDEPRQPRRPRRPTGLLASIPMERIACFESEPGHFEVDLVHHSGSSTAGEYVHTLNMVDVATGWSEMVAVLGRSRRVMEDGFLRIAKRLPFPVLEVHSDNGGEFLSHHPLRGTGQRRHHPPLAGPRSAGLRRSGQSLELPLRQAVDLPELLPAHPAPHRLRYPGAGRGREAESSLGTERSVGPAREHPA